MSKVLLDGYGVRIKSIRGEVDNSCPDRRGSHEEGYREIVIETNKGDIIIGGCSNCHVLSWFIEYSELASDKE